MSKSKLKSEKKYQKIAKELEIILDYIPGLIFYKDNKNNFIRVNKYLADAHNMTKEDMEGKSLFDFYPKDQAQAYWDDDLEVIKSGKPKLNIEEPWETEEGTRWVSTNKIPYVDDNGKIIGIVGFSVDITERKKIEQKLRKSQEQLNTIFTSLKDAIFVISDNYKILFKNETAHGVFGEDIIGKECYEIIKGFEQPCEQCPIKKFAESDKCMVRFDQYISTPFIEGTKYFDIIATQLENYDGNPAILELLRDNTERVKMETEVRKLSAYNRNLIETSLDPFITIDPNGKIMDINRATEIVTGRSREELIGTEFSSLFTETKKAFEGYKKVFEIGAVQDYALEIQHVDGHTTPVLFNSSVFKDENGNISGIFAVARDITKRIAAERKLKESEENLKKFNRELEDKVQERTLDLKKEMEKSQMYLDVAGVIIIVINTDETIALLNRRGSEILGFNEKELIGKNWFDNFVPKGIRAEIKSVFKKLLAGEVEPIEYSENPILTKNGEERLIAWHNVILRDRHGTIIGTLSSGEDITERKKAELKLKESEEKYRLITENANDLITVLNNKFEHEYINENTYQRILGYNNKDMLGKTRHDIIHPNDYKSALDILNHGFKEGEGRGELRLRHKNGNYIWVETIGKAFKDSENNLKAITISRDITEHKKNEQELEKAVRELKRSNAELQQFAYVASHDLQEPLRMVASFTQLLQNRYQDKLDDDANDFINYAVDGATRMQNLISDLLIFSRVGTRGKPFRTTDMNVVLEAVMDDFRYLINETNTTLTYDPLPVIIADESQMIQLCQNLISNAIKFRSEELPHIHVSGEVKDEEWVFSVRDNGIGMDSKYFNRIFIIFQHLHKKNEYNGTGIGLPICKKIIQRHGGKIWVESELGKGSTFYFSIPNKEVNQKNES